MRMWLVPTELMCRKHLLGEHLEMHMFVGCIDKKISMQGYLDNGLVVLELLKERHDELVKEMSDRGYLHFSPLEQPDMKGGRVDVVENLKELRRRCVYCDERRIAEA